MFELNLYEIEAELRAVFPSLIIPSPLLLIGSGFNSIVLEAGGSIIFRIGKNSLAQEGYEKEIDCLSIIAPRIPFLVPIPKWHSKRSTYFPFGVIGYDKIPGIPLQPTLLNNTNLSLVARNTAKFLLALHQLSPDSLQLKQLIDQASKWEDQHQNVLPILKSELIVTEFNQIKQWWDHFLADKKMQDYNPVIQHGDLWYENMLVNTRVDKLIGIIDWEQLSIGDPAQDFATLFHAGEKFVKFVIDSYQSLGGKLDENFEYRMQRLWEAREFEGLYYAIKFDDPIELKDALRKLRHGPILRKIL
jgi:aminoglycoside phosphotransferase (APT) family kinase protein